ncbi:hypothetical protein ACHAXH_000545 [Discostella pseudostelligera]
MRRSIALIFVVVVGGAAAFSSPSPYCVNQLTSTSRLRRPLPSSLEVHNTAIDIDEESQRDISSFEEWASYNGIQRADGFQLVGEELFVGYLDVSAITTQDVPAGSTVLYIPNELILSSIKVMEEFGRLAEAEEMLISNGYGSEIRQYYLMVKILVELDKGRDSPWYEYLNSLPRFYSNGASMTPFCYTCIPPLLAMLCDEERVRLFNISVKQGLPFLSDEIKSDPDLWKWAYQVVYTRGFETDNGDFNICPMADYFNHGTDHEIWLTYDDAGNCYAQTTMDVPANSPLRMCYGDPTNPSFLLSRYGFLDESSPATFCKIIPPYISDEMKNLGYAENRMVFYNTGAVSEVVWDILLYMALGETDPEIQQQFYQAHMTGDCATKQYIHEQYYPLTAKKLANHINTFLAELGALEKKVDYGGKVAADDHPRLPLILRHNEFVKNIFLTVRHKQGLDLNGFG